MNSRLADFAQHCEELLYWAILWKDDSIEYLRQPPPVHLKNHNEHYGSFFNRGEIEITVTIKFTGETKKLKPWGTTDKTRKERDDKIVQMIDDGIGQRIVGERLDIPENTVNTAYLRRKKQLEKE